MARYTLVYGVRLVPEGSLTGADEGSLNLKDGSKAGLTLHTIDGTLPQLRRAYEHRRPHFKLPPRRGDGSLVVSMNQLELYIADSARALTKEEVEEAG